jgi:hypothetical protein
MTHGSTPPPAVILAAFTIAAGTACTALIGAQEPDEIFDSGPQLEAASPTAQQPLGMATDATSVYWTDIERERGGGHLASIPKSGAGVVFTLISTDFPTPAGGIAVAGGRVFWTFGQGILAVEVDGGVAGSQGPDFTIGLDAPGYGSFNPTILATPATVYASTGGATGGGGCVPDAGPSPGDDVPRKTVPPTAARARASSRRSASTAGS